jgi:hypothetical protein
MLPSDAFALIAELALGILGFGGIMVALGRREMERFGPRLLHMVVDATAALLYALVPLPLLLEFPDGTIFSSFFAGLLLFFLCGHLVYLGILWFRSIRHSIGVNRYLVLFFIILNIFVLIPVGLAAVLANYGWGYYLWGLIYLIFNSSYLFVRMVWLTWVSLHTGN